LGYPGVGREMSKLWLPALMTLIMSIEIVAILGDSVKELSTIEAKL